MADKKISALPPASTPLAGTEVLPIVQGGTTDQVSVANLTAGRNMATKAIIVTQTTVGSGGFKIAAELLASDYPAARFLNTTANDGALIGWDTDHFSIATNTTNGLAGTERLAVFKTSGDVKVNTGNLVIGTAAKGIDFSANTHAAGMTSELLNDYEEGTWTPTVSFGGASTGITYATQTGFYTKVGSLVHVSGRVDLSNKGSATGDARIDGLPYLSATDGAGSVGFQLALAPSDKQVMLTVSSATLSLIVRYADGTSTSVSQNTHFANNSICIFSATYRV